MKTDWAKQELFDAVVAHARTMTHKSQSEDEGRCYYRAPDGNRCFIGGIIPDEDYRPRFDNEMSVTDANTILTMLGFSDDNVLTLACQLQDIHDNCDMNEWEELFEMAALEHELVYTAKEAA